MKNYFIDKTALDIPWVESPFFNQLLESSNYTEEEKVILKEYNEKGYLVIDLELTDEYIDSLLQGVFNELEKLPTQDSKYHYSESPRIFEGWKTNPYILELARHPKIISTLELLYDKKAIPFQTINFLYGSNQPLHQDSIHFYTQPERWMVGTWTALQDMTEDCGPLNIVPGSHKWPHYNFQSLNLPKAEFGEQFDNYHEYENFLIHLVDSMNGERKKWLGKKGQCLIWASNLLHGGAPILSPSSTRYAQATHFYFEGCNHYYSPLFSDTPKGFYADKNLKNKNILNHKI
jgi:hypothetical protein